MSTIHHSAEHIADAIIALINSRVQSPTKAELVAIIAPVLRTPVHSAPEAEGRLSELRAALHEMETRLDACDGSDKADDLLQAANRRFDKLARAVWATPSRTLADLQERAVMARHAHRDVPVVDKQKAPRWVGPADCDDWHDQCIAELIHAVENFGGELPLRPAIESFPPTLTRS